MIGKEFGSSLDALGSALKTCSSRIGAFAATPVGWGQRVRPRRKSKLLSPRTHSPYRVRGSGVACDRRGGPVSLQAGGQSIRLGKEVTGHEA